MSGQHRLAPALLLALLLPACAEPEPPAAVHAAPVSVRGAVVIEPPRLVLGQTAIVEIAVLTPPGHRVSRVGAPGELPGLSLLEQEPLPVLQEPQRWVHRTHFHVRARHTGSFVWPAQSLGIEAPDGTTAELVLEPQPFEVAEITPELPGRSEPFGWRAAPRPAPAGTPWLAALGGAAAALAGVGLVALLQRLRRRATAAPGDAGTPTGPDEPSGPGQARRAAEAALAAAEQQCAGDPVGAANCASAALRGFAAYRYAVPADRSTTQELEAREPPAAAAPGWAALLDLLQRLDARRFPAPADSALSDAEELRALLREARRFLADAPLVPPGAHAPQPRALRAPTRRPEAPPR